MFLGHFLVHAVSRTRAGQFFGLLMTLPFVLALPALAVAGLSSLAWEEFANEASYSKRYGENWKEKYEAHQGSLSKARTKACLAISGAILNSFLGVLLYRQLFKAFKASGLSSRPHRRLNPRGRSPLLSRIKAGFAPQSSRTRVRRPQEAPSTEVPWNGEAPPLRDPGNSKPNS